MSRREAAVAMLAVLGHAAFMLALIRTGATSTVWPPVQVAATCVVLAVIWRTHRGRWAL